MERFRDGWVTHFVKARIVGPPNSSQVKHPHPIKFEGFFNLLNCCQYHITHHFQFFLVSQDKKPRDVQQFLMWYFLIDAVEDGALRAHWVIGHVD